MTANPASGGPRGSFPTTRWSLVLNAQSVDPARASAALEDLCRQYWYPIYAFIRRRGRSHHEAEDLTQGFFARLLDSELIDTASAQRGRFRTLLLTAATHFFTDEWRRAHAQKRGSGHVPVPLDLSGAEERFAADPRDLAATPEEDFDRTWALSLIERALAELRDEYDASGRKEVFAALAQYLWSEAGSQATVAERLGMTEHAFTMAVSRLRARLRKRLRDHVAATVDHETDVGDELRYLLGVVRTARHTP